MLTMTFTIGEVADYSSYVEGFEKANDDFNNDFSVDVINRFI